MSIRTERVASVIREALARPVSDLGNELDAGMVSITHVRISADLRHARVYLSIFNGSMDPPTAVKRINERAGALRRQLGASVHLRYTPDLKFFVDDTLDTMDRIRTLLESTPPAAPQDDDSSLPHSDSAGERGTDETDTNRSTDA